MYLQFVVELAENVVYLQFAVTLVENVCSVACPEASFFVVCSGS